MNHYAIFIIGFAFGGLLGLTLAAMLAMTRFKDKAPNKPDTSEFLLNGNGRA